MASAVFDWSFKSYINRPPDCFSIHLEILKVTAEDHEDRQHLHSAKDVANKIASVHEGQEEITARVINNLITSVKSCPVRLNAID